MSDLREVVFEKTKITKIWVKCPPPPEGCRQSGAERTDSRGACTHKQE